MNNEPTQIQILTVVSQFIHATTQLSKLLSDQKNPHNLYPQWNFMQNFLPPRSHMKGANCDIEQVQSQIVSAQIKWFRYRLIIR